MVTCDGMTVLRPDPVDVLEVVSCPINDRLLGPGRKCDWAAATAAVHSGTAIHTSELDTALQPFQQRLDEVLRSCRCWRTAVGTGGPFCQRNGSSGVVWARVVKKTAAPDSVTKVVADDQVAAAAATKKADAAIKALLVSFHTNV